MAALVAALAVSYKTGSPLVPGFVPEGPSEVRVYAYRFTWIDWKCLAADICRVAGIAPPALYLRCPGDPLVTQLAAPRDPDASVYWHPLVSKDVDAEFAAAEAAGHELPPVLTIVFDPVGAAGLADGALQQLYSSLAGQTALMAGLEADEPWIEDFGPVIRLPSLHDSVQWRDVLARITGGDSDEAPPPAVPLLRRRSRRPDRSPVDPAVPQALEEVRAFFVVEGIDALSAFLRDVTPTNRNSSGIGRERAVSRAGGYGKPRYGSNAMRLNRALAPRRCTDTVPCLTNGARLIRGWRATISSELLAAPSARPSPRPGRG